MQRREKAKAKAKGRKRQSSDSYNISEENNLPTSEKIAERTLNRLRTLGNQIFALSPFSEHFGRWLVDLRVVLSEFESSPAVSADDQFVKERSQILSNVELELEEIRHKEASREEGIKGLSDKRVLLERIEEEHTAETRGFEGRKDSEIRHLSSNVDGLRKEVDRIARMKTGIFRAISKKAKAQKEAEAIQGLNSAQVEFASAVQNFATEQEKIQDEYERRKQFVIGQIQEYQKEIEYQEIDASLEARRASCEALINAVNALIERQKLSLH
jgi:hypothetical protein